MMASNFRSAPAIYQIELGVEDVQDPEIQGFTKESCAEWLERNGFENMTECAGDNLFMVDNVSSEKRSAILSELKNFSNIRLVEEFEILPDHCFEGGGLYPLGIQ